MCTCHVYDRRQQLVDLQSLDEWLDGREQVLDVEQVHLQRAEDLQLPLQVSLEEGALIRSAVDLHVDDPGQFLLAAAPPVGLVRYQLGHDG